ncbi:MAG: glycosyltransferase family 39 protein [Candidatus Peribacteria bacterium]|nr:glycosyltransferase family 39 protein [Candidatus Peribacteria bacterium]
MLAVARSGIFLHTSRQAALFFLCHNMFNASLISFLRRPAIEQWLVPGFFVLVFAIGVFSFRQFGVATDEGTMDSLGRDTYNYVFHGAEWPTNPAWRYHGTAVELPLQIAQNIAAPADDQRTTYKRVFTQHFFTFLLSFAGLVTLYFLARKHFGSREWALLTCVLLFLSPRFFAQSFYNSRDIPELVFFTLSMLTLLWLSERRTYKSAVIHGVATALALAVRMPALIILVLTTLYLGLDALEQWLAEKKTGMQRSAILFAVYLLTVAVATTIFWPFLWTHTATHFLEAYRFMSSLGANMSFMGHTYTSTPWQYVPVWIFLTVPPLYSVFFLAGIVSLSVSGMRHGKNMLPARKNELLFAAWFFLPIISIVVTKAGIYNEWRHVLFIYPAFLLMAVGGIRHLSAWIEKHHAYKTAEVMSIALALQLLLTGFWMIRNHPLEFAYFSLPKSMVETFTPGRVDYWGLSYREAVKYLMDHNTGIMSVYSPENIAYQNAYNIYPDSLKRMMRVPTADEAMFVVVSSPEDAKGLTLVRGITVDGHFLSGIYQGPVKEVLVDRAAGSVEFRR